MTPGTPAIPSSNELADDRTKLAFQRTVVALDRTLMAWVRTATSLISFGFTIYKFFQALRSTDGTPDTHLVTPRGLALILIGIGVLGLTAATVQYRRELHEMRKEYSRYGPFKPSITMAVASIISALGVLGFVVVLLRQ